MIVLAVVLCGALGAVSRFVIDGVVKSRLSTTFPVATLLINVTGSALLGVIAGLAMFHAFPSPLVSAVGTGFCGGYTTFSTASVDVVTLSRGGERFRAGLYAISTLLLSTGACALGLWLVS